MRHGYLKLSCVLLCSISSGALAQATQPASPTGDPEAEAPPVSDTKAPAPDEVSGLEDIVVTATRREERLQDIPVTVTAITSASLRGSSIVEVRELTQVVPGFTGGRAASVMQPVIRGVGSSGVSVGDEANVATYVDGIYQPDPFSTSLDLVEVERVEVLRGPQGTVFGRNATGGLINVITPDPSFDARGRVAGRLGRMRNDAYDYDLRGYLTGGLSDTVAADMAVLYRGNDGYIDDLVRGGFLGDVEVFNLRSKLMFKRDSAKVILTGEFAKQDSTLNAFQPYQDITKGKPPRFPNAIIPTGPWQASVTELPQVDYERINLSLRTQFDLGAVNLETSTGYLDSDANQLSDGDSSNILLSQLPFNTQVKTYSQEVRLLSDSSGPLTWLVGAYAFHLDGFMDVELQNANDPVPGTPLRITRLYPEIKTKSLAGFAEGTYELVDRLFLTLGARYTTEKREFRQRRNGVQLNETSAPPNRFAVGGTAKKKFNKWTYRGALRYEFARKANVFISYGTGFKSGVFNAVGTSPLSTDPETISAWEGGIKADPLPWLRTNLAVYHYDYKDLQVNARDAVGTTYILQNAATAKIYGGELELTLSPTPDLNVRASSAYTHGEYEEFPLAQTFSPRPGGFGNDVIAADVSGNRIIRAPRTSFNLGFDWGHDVANGRLMLVGNLFRSGRVYHDFANNFSQKPYTLASGELSWLTSDERWRFSLWGKNLTNAKVYQQVKPGALSTDVFYEPPRKLGIGAEFKF